MKYKGVILDLDGTMVNTEYYADEAWRRFLNENGYDSTLLPDDIVGAGKKECEISFKNTYGQDFDYYKASDSVRSIKFELFRNAQNLKKEGLDELLEYLRTEALKVSIGSSSYKKYIEYVLSLVELDISFDAIVSGDMVERAKPDPDIFIMAADLMGLKPEECLVIEDSINGITAAQAGGFDVVYIPDISCNPNNGVDVPHLSKSFLSRLVPLRNLTEARSWLRENN